MKTKIITILFTVAVLITGCYTVTRHPQIKQESYLSSKIGHREICSSCHAGTGKFTFENPYQLRQPFSSRGLMKWNDYYHYPWWADAFYYPAGHADPNNADMLPIDPRSLKNRSGSPASTAPGLASPGAPGIRLSKKASAADSTKESIAPSKKPTTEREKLGSSKKAKRKKKNN